MALESRLMGPAGQLESSESRKLFHWASSSSSSSSTIVVVVVVVL